MTKRNQSATPLHPDEADKFIDVSTEPEPKPAPAKPKRPRTESPETLATRAHRIRRELHERLEAEIARHTAKRAELNTVISAHDDECRKLPEAARVIFERLVG
jgi:hypothetical protein